MNGKIEDALREAGFDFRVVPEWPGPKGAPITRTRMIPVGTVQIVILTHERGGEEVCLEATASMRWNDVVAAKLASTIAVPRSPKP